MGHKIHPKNFRLGYLFFWESKWFQKGRKFREALQEDYRVRKFIISQFKEAAISSVEIIRSSNTIDVNIYTARPGMIIGRGGDTIEKMKNDLKKIIKTGMDLRINLKEISDPETSADLIAQNIVENLEKRMPFRRVANKTLERYKDSPKVKGIKLVIAGRLDGAEIARREKFEWGKMPLHTLRANIDFSLKEAHIKYGVLGIKVWVYKGEIFMNKIKN